MKSAIRSKGCNKLMLTHQMCILIKQLNWGDPVYVVFEKTNLALGAVFNGHLGFIRFLH